MNHFVELARAVVPVLFVGAAFSSHAFSQDSPRQSAVGAFQKTLGEFLATKDVAKAEEGFTEALKLDPTYAQPHYNLAVLAETREDWTTAAQESGVCDTCTDTFFEIKKESD